MGLGRLLDKGWGLRRVWSPFADDLTPLGMFQKGCPISQFSKPPTTNPTNPKPGKPETRKALNSKEAEPSHV